MAHDHRLGWPAALDEANYQERIAEMQAAEEAHKRRVWASQRRDCGTTNSWPLGVPRRVLEGWQNQAMDPRPRRDDFSCMTEADSRRLAGEALKAIGWRPEHDQQVLVACEPAPLPAAEPVVVTPATAYPEPAPPAMAQVFGRIAQATAKEMEQAIMGGLGSVSTLAVGTPADEAKPQGLATLTKAQVQRIKAGRPLSKASEWPFGPV